MKWTETVTFYFYHKTRKSKHLRTHAITHQKKKRKKERNILKTLNVKNYKILLLIDVSFNCWEAEVNSGFKSDIIADIFIPTCLCLYKNNTQNISTGGSWLFIKKYGKSFNKRPRRVNSFRNFNNRFLYSKTRKS